VAVCSAAPDEIEWAQSNTDYQDFNIATYSSYEDMLSHPGLQAVWISTSTDVHAIQTIKAVEKGLHVLCEKPLSTDLDEVRSRPPLPGRTYLQTDTAPLTT
jgi:myo-inositol 2-dehydrogenase/D-chiro-inositol 1-dehydrogenase